MPLFSQRGRKDVSNVRDLDCVGEAFGAGELLAFHLLLLFLEHFPFEGLKAIVNRRGAETQSGMKHFLIDGPSPWRRSWFLTQAVDALQRERHDFRHRLGRLSGGESAKNFEAGGKPRAQSLTHCMLRISICKMITPPTNFSWHPVSAPRGCFNPQVLRPVYCGCGIGFWGCRLNEDHAES